MENFPALPDYILALVFGIILPFVSGFRSKAVFAQVKTEFDDATKRRFYLGNSFFLFVVAFIIILIWTIYQRPLAELGFISPQATPNNLHWWLIALFVLLYLMEIVYSFASPEELKKTKDRLENSTPFMPTQWTDIPAYLVMCLAAGICEEIIFRGYMITFFRYVLVGVPGAHTWAILTPAFIFSIAHYYQGAKTVFKILVLSVLFGMIYWHSGSLYAVMMLHFLIDFVSGVVSIIVARKDSSDKL